jgi:hypothetical protein
LLLFGLAQLTACTVHQYEIPHDELERLARAPTEQRGERVRVLQQTWYDQDELVSVDAQQTDAATNTALLAVLRTEEERRLRERQRDDDNAESDADDGDDDEDDDAARLAGAALAAFAVATVILAPVAVTEGVRHDGYARLQADQPLFLVGPQRWVSLAELGPNDVLGAQRAVAPGWGGRVQTLERRPLDRVGLAYTLEFGGARLPRASDDALLGYGGRLTLGGHPLQELGFFVGGQFAYGSQLGDARFLGKVFGAAEYLPAALGVLHAGLFAEAGLSAYAGNSPRTDDRSGLFVTCGPVLQLALSTRLALTLRAGATNTVTDEGRTWLPEASFGVAVY